MDSIPATAPYGYCQCGCGEKTRPAPANDPRYGIVKGEPLRYIFGHQFRAGRPTAGPNPSGLCQCGCGQQAPIAPRHDQRRGIVKGQPIRFCLGHSARRPAAARFWEKVAKGAACWEWQGTRNAFGYGKLRTPEGFMQAHRFAWLLTYGAIPDDLFVCHHCDNPRCVRPDHLFLGTARDNTQDMMAKGRDRAKRSARQPSPGAEPLP